MRNLRGTLCARLSLSAASTVSNGFLVIMNDAIFARSRSRYAYRVLNEPSGFSLNTQHKSDHFNSSKRVVARKDAVLIENHLTLQSEIAAITLCAMDSHVRLNSDALNDKAILRYFQDR